MFGRRKTTTLTYLGSGSEFEGNLKTEGSLRVDGFISGTVEVNGDIEISTSGGIEGPELKGNNILVYGRVKARVVADGKLTLSNTAHLEGDVVANSLEIAPGAVYIGYIATREDRAIAGSPDPKQLPVGNRDDDLRKL